MNKRELALPGIVAGAVNALTAPGRALSGSDPTFNAPEEAANVAMNVMGGSAGGIVKPAPAGQLGMTAYHGSPHTFDKFSLDKIGTGEGAQAYGHGLYLAENPEVAEQYRNALSTYHTTLNGEALSPQHPQFQASMSIAANGYDEAVKQAKAALESGFIDKTSAAKQLADIEALKGAVIKQKQNGNTYKTDIPDEAVARFLDWDKPLSQQAPEVQAALAPIIERTAKSFPDIRNADPTGAGLYRAYKSHRGNNADYASEAIKESGIPGIRYLDEGSRGAGQGSSNFVSFDPEMIRILERNGVPTGAQPWNPGEYQGKLAELLSNGNKE